MKKLYTYGVAAIVIQNGVPATVSVTGYAEAASPQKVKGMAFECLKAQAPTAAVAHISVMEINPAHIAAHMRKAGDAKLCPEKPGQECDCAGCKLAKALEGQKPNLN